MPKKYGLFLVTVQRVGGDRAREKGGRERGSEKERGRGIGREREREGEREERHRENLTGCPLGA